MVTAAQVQQIRQVRLPVRYSVQLQLGGLRLSCLEAPGTTAPFTLRSHRSRGPQFRRLIAEGANGLVLGLHLGTGGLELFADAGAVAVISAREWAVNGETLDLHRGAYLGTPDAIAGAEGLRVRARSAWRRGIAYVHELAAEGELPARPGLRSPQVGALHAVAAHWTLSRDTATLVMPTGTGKTEVMMAVAVASCGERILIVVPTDALRDQTAGKFAGYGLLRSLGVLVDVPNPVVGTLTGAPTAEQMDAMRACNVVVTTLSSIVKAEVNMQRAFAQLFTEVFFDEAHHLPADTWLAFSSHCSHARTLLFTATPFREDGKPVPGRIIYNFPLQDAQEQGFFQPIRFVQVFEPDGGRADAAIAEAAVARLREDMAAGYDHVLLARAGKITQAERLFADIYSARAFADLNPVVIHSQSKQRRQVLQAVRDGRHRIVICVDMFGEGFDLPSLKVAALHAIHKSLGITLQFIGRFTRTAGARFGPASFVANTAEDGVPEALEGLYQENADWNQLVSDLSYDAIDPKARLSDLVANLQPVDTAATKLEISPLTLRPKISAEVFRVRDFKPQDFRLAFRPNQSIHQPHLSGPDRLIFFVVNQAEAVEWTDSRDIAVDTWDLFIAYHDPRLNLLYIGSSRKYFAGKLAAKLSTDPEQVRNEDVFRAFSGLRRLTLHSVGLISTSRNVRYQMFAGLDVRHAIDPVLEQDKMKSNVTGVGYENGRRVSVGCSRKGKIWSLQTGSLADWRQWCDEIGAKLANNEAEPNDFLRHTLVPSELNDGNLPASRALMADWPEQLFEAATFRFDVTVAEERFDFHNCALDLVEWTPAAAAFTFALYVDMRHTSVFRLTLHAERREGLYYSVVHIDGPLVEIVAFGRTLPAAEFFTAAPPLVRLEDGSQVSGDIVLRPREVLGEVYPRAAIMTLDWVDTNLTEESRWRDGAVRPRSIQQRFIEFLEQGNSAFIIDDDDTGESADIVAIEDTEQTITVTLWHCKYSAAEDAGNRVQDLFEVCGQAQKSIKWTWSFATLVRHIVDRETKHRRGRPTRFIRGTLNGLVTTRKGSRRKYVVFKVGIVQPGLRKGGIGNEHLAILGATSLFLRTVTNHPLLVYAS